MNENDIIHLHEIVWILECCDFSILFFTPVLIEMSSPCPAPPWRWARPARWLVVRPSLALLPPRLSLYQTSQWSRQVLVWWLIVRLTVRLTVFSWQDFHLPHSVPADRLNTFLTMYKVHCQQLATVIARSLSLICHSSHLIEKTFPENEKSFIFPAGSVSLRWRAWPAPSGPTSRGPWPACCSARRW